MTGAKGKSGGLRDGAGRPRSTITIKLGDQFYVPMRGLATVTEITYQRFVVEVDGEKMIFDAQSHTQPTSTHGGTIMKFSQLSIGDQFRTVRPITFHTTRDIFTRVDTHDQPLSEQRACNAMDNGGVLVQLSGDVEVTRISQKSALVSTTQSGTRNDITSGLGIGGSGSDDYNISTETEQPGPQFSRRKSSGQLWEPCSKRGCNNEPSCLDCGYCLDKHCHCGE